MQMFKLIVCGLQQKCLAFSQIRKKLFCSCVDVYKKVDNDTVKERWHVSDIDEAG